MTLFPKKKLVRVFHGTHTIEWIDAGYTDVNKIVFYLFEHPWFGRSWESSGFGTTKDAKAHPLFQMIVYPWVLGAELKGHGN